MKSSHTDLWEVTDSYGPAAEKLRGTSSIFWRLHMADWLHAAPERGFDVLWNVDEEEAAILMVAEPVATGEHAAEHSDPTAGSTQVAFRLFAQGEEHAVATQLERHGDLPRPDWALVSDGIQKVISTRVRSWLPSHWGNEWDAYWTTTPVAARSGEERVEVVNDVQEVVELLIVANPTTDALRDPDGHRWWGLRDDDGALVSVVGVHDRRDMDGRPVAALSGLGTLPTARGGGFGGALMAGATRRELTNHDIVSFGMWSGNDRARHLYERLGYRHAGRQVMASSQPFPAH
ncbi:GNAT family N-acetyltransferase [Actinobaculum sp. 313]|uniref:GNAT family N-acetyltransferase n=1 Tax=Actinobaculum sp. 313 TaxID=2495645 RepID=UPI000D5288BC|nr:GNAT family N-acetyltransferase [Actinobaculum sp. 313]AWE42336.1 hypothetical protein DDD63_05750 [Actinobaculum sp. 313]